MEPSKKKRKSYSAAEISSWLVQQIAKHKGTDAKAVNPQTSFADLGLGSLQAVALMGDLEQRLGRKLEPTLPWEYPTIEQLAQHLAQQPE